MMNDVNTRPTTTSPGAERPDDLRPSGRELAASRRADREPTLADANDDFNKLLAAGLLMQEWGLDSIEDAGKLAAARVRGARRRSGP